MLKWIPIVALLAAPASAGTVDTVKGALDKADAKAAEALEGSVFEQIFSSFFGLTYLGDAWGDLCGKAGGEWDGSVPECRVDLFDR